MSIELDKLKDVALHTEGNGWCSRKFETKIKRIEIDDSPPVIDETCIHVHITPAEGLNVYTDQLWLAEFREALRSVGFAQADEVNWTEQGIQEPGIVRLIVGTW
jgi:hypothetical protein